MYKKNNDHLSNRKKNASHVHKNVIRFTRRYDNFGMIKHYFDRSLPLSCNVGVYDSD